MKDVGIAREELQLKQHELGQAHKELKVEVAKLGKKLAARESILCITAPEFTPASSVSAGSGCDLAHTNNLHPMMVGTHGMPNALSSRFWLQSMDGLHRKKLCT